MKNEESILTEINHEIAAAKSKKQLLDLLMIDLGKIGFDNDFIISICNPDKTGCEFFLTNSPKKQNTLWNQSLQFKQTASKQGHFFGDIFTNEGLSFFKIESLLDNKNAPNYIKLLFEAGVAEMATIALFDQGVPMGLMTFFLREFKAFKPDLLRHVELLVDSVAIAVSHIVYMDEIRQREKERETLLSLSHQIASIKSKMDLLPILREKFKSIGLYTDIAISLINEDRTTTTGYLIDWEKRRHQHPGYVSESTAKHVLADGIFDVTLSANEPVLFDLEKVIQRESVPSYIQFLYGRGIRHLIASALRNEGQEIGIIYLFSNSKRSFYDGQLKMLYGMCQQIGTAVATIRANERIRREEEEKSLLLDFSYDIARVRGKKDLLDVINNRLKSLFNCTHCGIGIVDRESGSATLFLKDPASVAAQSEQFADSFKYVDINNDNILTEAISSQRSLIFDLEKEEQNNRLPEIIRQNLALGIKEMLAIPLRNEMLAFGLLCLFSDNKDSFKNRYFNIVDGVGSQVSIAVANIIANEKNIQNEKEKSFLLSVAKDITSCRNKDEFLEIVHQKLGNLFQYNEIVIDLINDDNKTHSAFGGKLNDQSGKNADAQIHNYEIKDGLFDQILKSNTPQILDLKNISQNVVVPPYIKGFLGNGSKYGVAFPLFENNETIGVLFVLSTGKINADTHPLNLAMGISSQISIGVSNIRAYERIQSQLKEIDYYKSLLEEENTYLQQQIKSVLHNGDMIGRAAGLKEVSDLIGKVSKTDITVLISGESGTGKELVARALHDESPRKAKLMIKVNCAALPATLIESELFGHEKGSFTGATERRIGKFELANNGTLFLDEIGELALELQVKLLRVLQEKEIERIGGKDVIKTDVRIIAATNRDLQKEVEAGRFRSDLYYRLNVFPITLPSLRDHIADIPELVSHFINKVSSKLGKKVTGIAPGALNELKEYGWPGNIRELEHVIERSALMATGSIIENVFLPAGYNKNFAKPETVHKFKGLDDSERDYIISVLKRCKGRIKGDGGAAILLGVPATTLHSKMKKLGISKADY